VISPIRPRGRRCIVDSDRIGPRRPKESPDGKTITVEVIDLRTDEYFALDVAPEFALDAFHHPFAYLAEVETHEWADELLAA
jgi:hypothetical protein